MYGSSIVQIYPDTAQKGYVIIKLAYEVRPRKDHRGVAAISDALPFIIVLIVGGVLVFTLLYFGSFLVTRRQNGRLRNQTA